MANIISRMMQTDDIMGTPFTYETSVGFLDNLDDGTQHSGSSGNDSMQSAFGDQGYSDDWTQSLVNLNEDIGMSVKSNVLPPSSGAPTTQGLSLDMYGNDAVDELNSMTMLDPISSASPISPAGASSVSSDFEQFGNIQPQQQQQQQHQLQQPQQQQQPQYNSYPDLPTPPANFISQPITTANSPDDESPGAMSNESMEYTTKKTRVKQESISPSQIDNGEPHSMPKKTGNNANNATKAKASKVTKQRKEKTSHNMIEKRYRTNINDKISALRECVPSLRCALNGGGGGGGANEDLEGLTPASKLNKATVLTKATEYINHLQHKNDVLEQKVAELQVKLHSLGNPVEVSSNSSSASGYSSMSANGMDATPTYPAYPQQAPYEIKSRLLMGSLAGMMTTGMFADMDGNTQGLAAMPLPILGHKLPLITVAKMAMVAGAAGYCVAPLFYSSQSKAPKKLRKTDIYTTTKMRKQVWEITSKTMGVPDGDCSIFAAVCAFLYALVAFFFVSASSAAAESSWSRAIDAQLCGGDVEINKWRVLTTFTKSLMIKPSARRYMRQAFHVKVMFKEWPRLADYFAMLFWNRAKKMSVDLVDHQHALLQSDVLHDQDTIQRVYNLAMNYPLNHSIETRDDDAIESVLRDQSIRAVVDVASAWYSCKLLQTALLQCIDGEGLDMTQFEKAGAIAPIDSVIAERFAVVEALLLGEKDGEKIKRAIDLVSEEIATAEEEEDANSDCPPLVNARRTIPQDMQLAMHCSFIIHFVNNKQTENGLKLVKRLAVSSVEDIGLLGFVAIYNTMQCLKDHNVEEVECRSALENLASCARVWIGSHPGERSGLPLARRRELVGECLSLSVQYGKLFESDYEDCFD